MQGPDCASKHFSCLFNPTSDTTADDSEPHLLLLNSSHKMKNNCNSSVTVFDEAKPSACLSQCLWPYYLCKNTKSLQTQALTFQVFLFPTEERYYCLRTTTSMSSGFPVYSDWFCISKGENMIASDHNPHASSNVFFTCKLLFSS